MSKAGAVPGVQRVSGQKHFSSQHCTTTRALLVLTLYLKSLLGKELNGPMSCVKGKHIWQEIYGSVNE